MSERISTIFGRHRIRPFGVLHGVDDVVAKRGQARLAAEVMIGVAQQPRFQRLGVLCAQLLDVDVLQIRLGRGRQADARGLKELHHFARSRRRSNGALRR